MLRYGYDARLFGGRGLHRRVPRHPDPTERQFDPQWRDRGRLGGQALCAIGLWLPNYPYR